MGLILGKNISIDSVQHNSHSHRQHIFPTFLYFHIFLIYLRCFYVHVGQIILKKTLFVNKSCNNNLVLEGNSVEHLERVPGVPGELPVEGHEGVGHGHGGRGVAQLDCRRVYLAAASEVVGAGCGFEGGG